MQSELKAPKPLQKLFQIAALQDGDWVQVADVFQAHATLGEGPYTLNVGDRMCLHGKANRLWMTAQWGAPDGSARTLHIKAEHYHRLDEVQQ